MTGVRSGVAEVEEGAVTTEVHAGPGLDDPESLDADAREARLDRVAVLYAQITAITREFLAAVAACDRHRDWAAAGFGSCAEWLAWRVGLGANAAGERVRVARALETLPLTSESMARGELSFSKVRALTRVATPDNEAELLDFARAGSTADLERIVRAWKTLNREDEASRERVLHRTRRFSVVPDGDGMYVVRGRLTPEVAAVLMRAVDAASDALYRAARAESDGHGSSDDEGAADGGIEPAQRRADAVGLLAERALAAGFGRGTGRGSLSEGAGEGDDAGNGDADDSAPISGSRAERYQVVLHVEPETLARDGEPGMSEFEDGTRLSAETARRLACDAALVRVERTEVDRFDDDHEGARGPRANQASAPAAEDRDLSAESRPAAEDRDLSAEDRNLAAEDRDLSAESRPGGPPAALSADDHRRSPRIRSTLDVGRRTRTVPPALRRALEARDRGCRFPGCGRRFTDAHHIEHWADGGPTRLSNLVLLCRHHHRRVHEEGWRVCTENGTAGRAVFFRPDGRALAAAPPIGFGRSTSPESTPDDPASDRRVHRQLAERGADPDWRTNLPRCGPRERVPWPIEAAAREALERTP